jgi:probable O-glycosylation ligase (exosortase A-associated)
MVIPLIRYLQLRAVHRWARRLLGVSIGLCALMALGTHSRGALVGIAAMLALFWWRNGNKALWGGGIVAGGVLALSFMPEEWWSRMQTIRTYDADASALGRLNAWGMAINIANDRVTGGGFSMWTGVVFQKYGPEADRVHAAHSIYFQALGEQGWIGLLLFLSIGVATWLTASDLMKLARIRADLKWAADLGSMVQVSMVGYAVAGAFLSLTWFDLPYNVMVMAVVARRLAQIDAALPARQEELRVANEAVQISVASSPFKPTLRQ